MNIIMFLLSLILLASVVFAESRHESIPRSGSVRGVIEKAESDVNGLFSIWFKVRGKKMHEFLMYNAKITGGSKAELQPGTHVQVRFINREQSEMDAFYTADAVEIRILKKSKANKSG